jgi:hypothetical protein
MEGLEVRGTRPRRVHYVRFPARNPSRQSDERVVADADIGGARWEIGFHKASSHAKTDASVRHNAAPLPSRSACHDSPLPRRAG